MKKEFSRRELLIGGSSAFLAAAVTSVAGIGAYKIRNALRPESISTAIFVASEQWMLSESDYENLAAADLPIVSDALTLYDQVDYPGSDIKALRVKDLGECVEACEGDNRCQSFTYAKSTHPLPNKRQMCWLKDANDLSGNDKAFGYVSGKRL